MIKNARLDVRVTEDISVSALIRAPAEPAAVYVFAHGAGAGMDHPFMERCAEGLADRAIATLRFQFPSMERGSRRVDSPAVAQATVRAAAARALALFPSLPLFAGGKSYGGRMTSQAQAAAPLAGVRGLAFIGFPLHPAAEPSIVRAAHLTAVDCPMLFLQGTRDALADTALLLPIVAALGAKATLHLLHDADHAFHVRRSSGTDDDAIRDELLDALARWMAENQPARTFAQTGA